MAITVSKVTTWQTSDGVQHTSRELADQYVLQTMMQEMLANYGLQSAAISDVLTALVGNRPHVRAWLDSCDTLDRLGYR